MVQEVGSLGVVQEEGSIGSSPGGGVIGSGPGEVVWRQDGKAEIGE